MAVTKEYTRLERRRLRDARIAVSMFVVILITLFAFSIVERIEKQGVHAASFEFLEEMMSDTSSSLATQEHETEHERTSDGDLLGIEQEGITFMHTREDKTILWYQSTWDVLHTSILIERALVLRGWQVVGNVGDSVQSFYYPADVSSAGGSLIVSLHILDEGCTVLVYVV